MVSISCTCTTRYCPCVCGMSPTDVVYDILGCVTCTHRSICVLLSRRSVCKGKNGLVDTCVRPSWRSMHCLMSYSNNRSSSRRMISDPVLSKVSLCRPCPMLRWSLVRSVKVTGRCFRWYLRVADVLCLEEWFPRQGDIASLADGSFQTG